MTAPTPNAALAYQVLDHIDAHPDLWRQCQWIGDAECGTVACFAGWACLLSGEKPDSEEPVGIMLRSGMPIPDKAEQLLGASRFVGSVVDGEWEEEDLFHEYNTREDLGRLVAEIFGPRPAPAVDHSACDHAGRQVKCDRCGAEYVCTPSSDFYCTPDGDHCCEPCLIGDAPLHVIHLSEVDEHGQPTAGAS